MATLGDILGSARRSAAGFDTWAEAVDPAFAATVKRTAAANGDSLSGFLRAAIADFSRFADEEAWAQLSRIVRDHPDPAMACLRAMVSWRIAAPACKDHVFDMPTRIDHEHPPTITAKF
jgi:hypothetical protein